MTGNSHKNTSAIRFCVLKDMNRMTTSARFTHIFRSFRHTSATQQAMWSSAAGMPKAEKRMRVDVVLFAVAYSTSAIFAPKMGWCRKMEMSVATASILSTEESCPLTNLPMAMS